ncbi:50S ribosomal protein L23 [Candidatus Saccharibacteria bacterium]|nr:50S ribosomal protein L23 [Candidatus Saccharibacteria bacterium]
MTARKKEAVEAPKKKKVVAAKYLTLVPRISEKAYALSENGNTYIFDVPTNANKFDISKSVAAQYTVDVLNVRVAGVPGKSTRSYRKGGRKSIAGQRSDIRKAYVTLAEGHKLPIFAAVETPDAPKETK